MGKTDTRVEMRARQGREKAREGVCVCAVIRGRCVWWKAPECEAAAMPRHLGSHHPLREMVLFPGAALPPASCNVPVPACQACHVPSQVCVQSSNGSLKVLQCLRVRWMRVLRLRERHVWPGQAYIQVCMLGGCSLLTTTALHGTFPS